MSTRTIYKYVTAGWREAARARDPYIDLDHLLIGLIAAGAGRTGPLAARHNAELCPHGRRRGPGRLRRPARRRRPCPAPVDTPTGERAEL